MPTGSPVADTLGRGDIDRTLRRETMRCRFLPARRADPFTFLSARSCALRGWSWRFTHESDLSGSDCCAAVTRLTTRDSYPLVMRGPLVPSSFAKCSSLSTRNVDFRQVVRL